MLIAGSARVADEAILFILNLYAERKLQFKNIVEFALFLTNRKSVVRLVGDLTFYEEIKSRIDAFGFACEQSDFMLRTIKSTHTSDQFQEHIKFHPDLGSEIVIYVGSKEAALEAKYVEAMGCDDLMVAKVYGYPTCCGSAYHEISQSDSWINRFMEERNAVRYSYLSNKIGYLIPPYLSLHKDYFPCSISCIPTMRLCSLAEIALSEIGLDYLVPNIRRHLAGLCLIVGGNLYFFWNYREVDGGFCDLETGWHMPLRPDTDEFWKCKSIFVRGQQVTLVTAEGETLSFANGKDGSHFVVFYDGQPSPK